MEVPLLFRTTPLIYYITTKSCLFHFLWLPWIFFFIRNWRFWQKRKLKYETNKLMNKKLRKSAGTHFQPFSLMTEVGFSASDKPPSLSSFFGLGSSSVLSTIKDRGRKEHKQSGKKIDDIQLFAHLPECINYIWKKKVCSTLN